MPTFLSYNQLMERRGGDTSVGVAVLVTTLSCVAVCLGLALYVRFMSTGWSRIVSDLGMSHPSVRQHLLLSPLPFWGCIILMAMAGLLGLLDSALHFSKSCRSPLVHRAWFGALAAMVAFSVTSAAFAWFELNRDMGQLPDQLTKGGFDSGAGDRE